MSNEPTAFTDGSVSLLDTQIDLTTHFDTIYREALGDPTRVPWARVRPNPMLVSWLNAEAAGRVRPGARAVVVGCGLGDDVVELVNRGYDVTGFDLSPTAIEWARKRFPDLANCFCTGDVLNMPTRFRHRFDLVVEIYTIQAVDPALRERMAEGVSQLACPRGLILTIARGREDGELLEHLHEPPYPLTAGELSGLFEARGWQPTRPIDDFFDDESPPKRRLRATFAHM